MGPNVTRSPSATTMSAGRRDVGADDARHRHPRRPERVDRRRQGGVRTGAPAPPAGRRGSLGAVDQAQGDGEEPRRAEPAEQDTEQLLRQQIAPQILDRRQERDEPRHVDEAGIEPAELRQIVGRLAVHREVAHRHCRDRQDPGESYGGRESDQRRAPDPSRTPARSDEAPRRQPTRPSGGASTAWWPGSDRRRPSACR